ncbi:hypothetical protein [Amycolatopsis sp. NPDC003861]
MQDQELLTEVDGIRKRLKHLSIDLLVAAESYAPVIRALAGDLRKLEEHLIERAEALENSGR